MDFERNGATKRQQNQAELVKERSVKRFKQAEIGDSVMVPFLMLIEERLNLETLRMWLLK